MQITQKQGIIKNTYSWGIMQMYLIQDEILSKCCIHADERVLVAFSGGPDSLALMLEMKRLLNEGKIHFYAAAHLNHMIRGESADKDAAFCRDFCKNADIQLFESSIDVPKYAEDNNLSIETAARNVRYTFLERIRANYGFSCIALGHHKNDQAETVLLHLLRGAGTDGIAGMRYKTGYLIRPFLECSKEEIYNFLLTERQEYCLDSSNEETFYERNNIRNRILPILKEINPQIIDALARTASYVRQDSDFLNDLAKTAYCSQMNRFEIHELEEPIRMRVLKQYLPYSDYESSDITTLTNILNAQTGTVRNLKYGYRAWVDSSRLHIDRYQKKSFLSVLKPGKTINLEDKEIVSEIINDNCVKIPCNPNEVYLDFELIEGDLTVRMPMDGDRFTPFGMKGSKLLSDYFTDKKIPRFERNLPVITDSKRIVAVLGCTIDEHVKITENTKKILHISMKEA